MNVRIPQTNWVLFSTSASFNWLFQLLDDSCYSNLSNYIRIIYFIEEQTIVERRRPPLRVRNQPTGEVVDIFSVPFAHLSHVFGGFKAVLVCVSAGDLFHREWNIPSSVTPYLEPVFSSRLAFFFSVTGEWILCGGNVFLFVYVSFSAPK